MKEESATSAEATAAAAAPAGGAAEVQVEGPGSIIGRYKLLEKIGEGGFGVVYMAEQLEPVTRRVALKIIKLGMDTREVVARFEAERQALALMDHPNVARVLDGGATNSGRPYFVMELVRGLAVTEFCDRNCLSPRERLELMIAVCRAVQHAHSKGIIHRDLKPSNILVTLHDGEPVPKIIDFGIAKAIEKPLTAKTLFTGYGQMVGTPVYMSPEQTEYSAVDVDTRSDVYSLGVVLYELLTSKQPFDGQRLLQVGHYEMMRIIREEDPPRPSTRLTTLGKELPAVAQRRHTAPKRLSEVVRGDLDWITMKCLQKDRSWRYETAAALAEDLQRHLEHRPVRAGPPSVLYRAAKFAQRHHYAVAMIVWIMLSLMAGLALSLYLYVNARTERTSAIAAERQADQQRQLALAEARRAQAKELRARQILYASDMALASHALAAGNLGRAQALLARYASGGTNGELRGWEWRYLRQQCQSSELFELAQLSNAVVTVSLGRDGRLALASDLGGRMYAWDLPGRALLWSSNDCGVGALSPDGKVAVDSFGRIRDAESGLVVGMLPGKEKIKALQFSPDGEWLAGLAGRDRLCLWHGGEWGQAGDFGGFPCSSLHFGALAFGLDPWLVVGTESGEVSVVNWRTGETVRRWRAHKEGVTSVAVSQDGQWIFTAAGYSEDQIRVWRLADGREANALVGHSAWISMLTVSWDGKLLASASADQSVGLWSMAERKAVGFLRGHLQEVWSAAFSLEAKLLVSGGKDGAVKVWRVPALEPNRPAGDELRAERFGFLEGLSREFPFASGREVLVLDKQGAVTRWALPALRSVGSLEALGRGNRLLASSSELGLSASINDQNQVQVWDWPSAQVAAQWSAGAASNRVIWLQFALQAKQLATVTESMQVELWEARSGARRMSSRLPEPLGGPLCLSPDGIYLAIGGNTLAIYDLSNSCCVARLRPYKTTVDALAFSPDGTQLASCSQDGVATVWRAGTWQEQAVLRGHLLGVHSVAFSGDGRRLATGSVGKEAVKLWDLSTMQEVLNIPGDGQIIFWLGFAPDGRSLLGLGSTSGLKCWAAAGE